jgi:hypothetical protein
LRGALARQTAQAVRRSEHKKSPAFDGAQVSLFDLRLNDISNARKIPRDEKASSVRAGLQSRAPSSLSKCLPFPDMGARGNAGLEDPIANPIVRASLWPAEAESAAKRGEA